MLSRNIVVSALTALALTSCGVDTKSSNNPSATPNNPSATHNLNGSNYTVVTPGNLLHNNNSISGTGAVVFNAPLSSVKSGNSFRLSFALDDSGKLELVSNATNQLAAGVTIRVKRTGSTVDVTTLAGDGSNQVLSSLSSANVDPTKEITLQIDVHNDESPAHVLIWDSSSTEFKENEAILNSEDDKKETPGDGAGTFWGLVLENAVVSAAARSDAKMSEEH